MPRMRLGVALLIPPPLDREVDALRRAVGDGALGRVPAHLTLVPPVNVRTERLDEAVGVVRRAAAATRPFTVSFGPPTTFLPDNPVLYLPAEDGSDAVTVLRDRVFVEPLARPLTWPFVPHVTVADDASPERIAAARAGLAAYSAVVTFDRVHLLQEQPGRVWVPVADVTFAVPAVIGRGGLPVELTTSARPDPEAWAAVAGTGRADVTVTARRDGEVVGLVTGWSGDGVAHLLDLAVTQAHRRMGIGSHLVAAFEFWAAERGCGRLVAAAEAGSAAASLLRRRGWTDDTGRAGLCRTC